MAFCIDASSQPSLRPSTGRLNLVQLLVLVHADASWAEVDEEQESTDNG